jgi:hypothetical protein
MGQCLNQNNQTDDLGMRLAVFPNVEELRTGFLEVMTQAAIGL